MLELLDAKAIYHFLGSDATKLNRLEILPIIDSTNNFLLEKVNFPGRYAVFSEQQTAGRGRFNRSWFSPFGYNIYLSLLWFPSFHCFEALSGLSIAIGIGIVQTLEQYGIKQVALKWPNDLVYKGKKKLGGILIDTLRSFRGSIRVVVGVGLNVYNSNSLLELNQAHTDVYSILSRMPERNRLAALLLKNLLITLYQFQEHGFNVFLKHWHALDSLSGCAITIQPSGEQGGKLYGVACGVDSAGQLRVDIAGKIQTFSHEKVSVRPIDDKGC